MTPLLLLLHAPALAGAPDTVTGEERVIAAQLTPIATDAEGSTSGGDPWVENRLRVGLSGDAGDARIAFSGDLFTGMVIGDPYAAIDARSRAAASVAGFVAREASVTLEPGPELELGLVTSSWGLGMLANDGASDPWFGRTDFGDRVLRARMTTPAFGTEDIFFTAAVDRVVADEVAVMMQGQAAWQGILSLVKVSPDDGRLGIYAVYRYQAELSEGRSTRAAVVDLYGDHRWAVGAGELRAAAELAGILGSTDRATTYESPGLVGLRSGGATGLLSYTADGWALTGRAGAASADPDPDDGLSQDFTFHRDFDVGMVLYDELMGRVEGATYALLSDPANAGQPPDGAETLVTEGAFRRAGFVQPIVDLTPAPWLLLRAGAALSWSLAPYAQPFYTYRSGGVPTNQHDRPTVGGYLGTELDWLVQLGDTSETIARVRPGLSIQGGHLLVGQALQDAGPERVDLFLLTGRLRW